MRYMEPGQPWPSEASQPINPPKRKVWPFLLLGALLLLCCAGGIIQVAKSMDDSPSGVNGQIYVSTTPNPPASAGKSKAKTHAPPPPASIGEGQWVIGEDAEPGRYKTDGADPDLFTMCVWTVYAKEGGDVVNFGTSGEANAPGRVTLKRGQFFDTTGCKPWVRQSS